MYFQSELSDFVQNPLISQSSLNILQLKCNLGLFVIPDTNVIVHYCFLDKCIGYFQKLENRVLKNSLRGPL